MKFLLLIIFFFSLTINAQIIKVLKVKPVKNSGNYMISGISPDEKKLLVSGPNYKGLYLIDIKTGEKKIMNESPGAGYGAVFSPDGQHIVYKSDVFIDKRKVSSLKKINIHTRDSFTFENKSRNIGKPVIAGTNLIYYSEGKHHIKDLDGRTLKTTINETYVLSDKLVPVLFINGERKEYKPGGNGQYIWISLSPDKTKMLYCLIGKGTYVSDLKGNILAFTGKLNAPKWLNNEIIIGMDDKDDGKQILSSEIIAYSLKEKKRIELTSTKNIKEMHPFPFPDGKSIAFRDDEGKLYIMKIKLK